MTSGYSNVSLVQKLGLRPEMRIKCIAIPPNVKKELGANLHQTSSLGKLDFIIGFFRTAAELESSLPNLVKQLESNGILWLAWPKQTSPLHQDLAEREVHEMGLATGLVDVKVCAIDKDWSGFKFVYRLRDR